jgi:hypothetical protein
MAKRRHKPEGTDANGRDRRRRAADATQSTEGRMVGEKDELSDKELELLWERYHDSGQNKGVRTLCLYCCL